MFRKRDIETERILRREEAKRKRLERIVSGYVKYTHPEIYGEAYEFYTQLDAIYPKKNDLRKTPQFQSLKHNAIGKTNKRAVVHHTSKKTAADNLVLNIPLIQRRTKATTSTTAASVQETPVLPPVETSTATTTKDQETATTMASVQETSVLLPVETATETGVLSTIDEATLNEIIADLRDDSTIHHFFDNMEFDIDDCPLW